MWEGCALSPFAHLKKIKIWQMDNTRCVRALIFIFEHKQIKETAQMMRAQALFILVVYVCERDRVMFADYNGPAIIIPGLACVVPIPYLARHVCGPVD